MMRTLAWLALGGFYTVIAQKPPQDDKAGTARWMVNQVSWGVIATTNVRLNGTAFGNPISLSDALNDGHPYFYVSQLDESMKDIRAQNQCTLSLSEASLDCAALKLDPEDPRCTRLSLTGALKNVTDPSEHDKAQAVLFKQHPSMKSWPADHNWLIVKLDIQEIWLIDFFGGASDITPADYLAVKPIQRGTPADPSHTPVKPQPSFLKKADTARWLVHEATWGTFATTSVHLKGLPFANPVSIADGTDDDATGTPFFCVSPLDASMQDIAKNPLFSLTVSQAEVDCGLKKLDPEDPRCTRLTFSGSMEQMKVNTTEWAFAKKSLVARHPDVEQWLDMGGGHDFTLTKMNITDIWLIDFFGGASHINVKDYYDASAAARYIAKEAAATIFVV